VIFVGCDPGLDGGIAIQCEDGDKDKWWDMVKPMPTTSVGKKREIDEQAIIEFLDFDHVDEILVTIEKVHAMPKQGVTSMFNFGLGYGLLRGICSGLGIPYQLVTPQAWKKVMLAGYAKGSEYQVASHLWPDVDFRATARCRKAHSGKVDAALICEFGRRKGGA